MSRGVKFGRPRKLTAHQRREALASLAAGETQADIARTYNVDPRPSGVCNDCSGALRRKLHAKRGRTSGTCGQHGRVTMCRGPRHTTPLLKLRASQKLALNFSVKNFKMGPFNERRLGAQ